MATISLSTAYASRVTDEISNSTFLPSIAVGYTGDSGITAATALANHINSDTTIAPSFGTILHPYVLQSGGGFSTPGIAGPGEGVIEFRNSSGSILTSYSTGAPARSIDDQGYLVLANFPPKIPVLAGTISTIVINVSSVRQIALTVGAPGGSSDIQFDDRILVTTQPWRLDGSIKFRVPVSYDYTV